jgi:hypothetical protein
MHASDPTSPQAGRPDSARPGSPSSETAGEHPYPDLTVTFAQRCVLRRLSEGRPLDPDLDLDVVVGPLVGAGLVGHDGAYWTLTTEGRAYLAAHEEAVTRRLPRPGPPKMPEGWSCGGPGGQEGFCGLVWRFESKLQVHHLPLLRWPHESEDLELDRAAEVAHATLSLVRYLRQLAAYQSRAARDGADRPPQRAVVSDGIEAGAGEPSPCEVAP